MATKLTKPTLPELPDELLAAIGKLATEWARFEFRLDTMMMLMLGNRDAEASACVTSQIVSSGRKLDAIIALSVHRGCNADIVKQLRSLAGKTQELQRRRNRTIHDLWISTVDGIHYRLEITAEKAPVFEHKPILISDIISLATAVRLNLNNFIKLQEQIIKDKNVMLSLAKAFAGTHESQVQPVPPEQH